MRSEQHCSSILYLALASSAKPDEGVVANKGTLVNIAASVQHPLIRPSNTFSPSEKRGGEGARFRVSSNSTSNSNQDAPRSAKNGQKHEMPSEGCDARHINR